MKILGDQLMAGKAAKPGSGGNSGDTIAQQRQMEALRQRVQDAYAQVRKKRREGGDKQTIVL